MRSVFLAALAAAFIPLHAQALEVTGLAPFKAVELVGDGRIDIRRGAAQQVALQAGDRWEDTFTVNPSGSLVIKGCKGCGDKFHVVITSPSIEGLSVVAGGKIIVDKGFAAQPGLLVNITGGGEIDARHLAADAVNAVVTGEGEVQVTAVRQLLAMITGGGEIIYRGDPKVTSKVIGGGTIERAAD